MGASASTLRGQKRRYAGREMAVGVLGGVAVGSWGMRAGEAHGSRLCDVRVCSGLERVAPLERCDIVFVWGYLTSSLGGGDENTRHERWSRLG